MQDKYRNNEMFRQVVSALTADKMQDASKDKTALSLRSYQPATTDDVDQLVAHHKARTQRKGTA